MSEALCALPFQISFYSQSPKNFDFCGTDGSIKQSNDFIGAQTFQWAEAFVHGNNVMTLQSDTLPSWGRDVLNRGDRAH